jgi:hypothetical protein
MLRIIFLLGWTGIISRNHWLQQEAVKLLKILAIFKPVITEFNFFYKFMANDFLQFIIIVF